jgi:glutamate--cysteine ligase
MPTPDQRFAVKLDEARIRAGERAFPHGSDQRRIDGVGLEPEFFPIFRDSERQPAGRVPLADTSGRSVLGVVDGLSCSHLRVGCRTGGPVGPWQYNLGDGGRLTFEPGAQVEHSTAVYPTASSALADVQVVLDLLRQSFRPLGAILAAAGVDLWHDVENVPQQLPFGRYTAQAAYYEQRGVWGRIMMRHTASVQINLDLGPEGVWQERWLLANLISPLITASFACSPGTDSVSARARAWQELDPTRSGFPRLLVEGEGADPRAEWAAAALSADVMLIRLDDGRWEAGTPGFNFERWIVEGHPEYGWPTVEDLDYHLTTLFFEVRPRGFLELRAGEAVPDWMRAAQVVLVTALLYEEVARAEAIGLLERQRGRLPELWRRAACQGVHEAELRALASGCWEAALKGVERIGSRYFGEDAVSAARRFLDRYTARGRTPADTLRDLHEKDPATSLAWAASEHDDPS